MPAIFSKIATNVISRIPPDWILYFMRLSTAKKYSLIASIVGLVAFLTLRKGKRRDGKSKKPREGSFSAAVVNMRFVRQMKFLLKIMIPSFTSTQALIILSHTAILSAKTFLSIYVAGLEGMIIKEIVSRNVSNFFMMLMKWFVIAIPACFLNSSMRYLEKQLAISFRTKLVQHAYKAYFDNQVYYRVGNLDTRLQNPDHSLTEDISTFANSVAHLYSHLMKPTLDAFLISFTLIKRAKSIGGNPLPGAILTSSVIYITSQILKNLSPKFGQLAGQEADLKAKLRHCHSRIVTNSEEIAFYGGSDIEKKVLENAYRAQIKQSQRIYFSKLWYVIIEQYLMKYVWAGTGMLLTAIPILTSSGFNKGGGGTASRTEYYMTTKNLLMTGSDATERLFSSYKEIVELAGYSERVANIFTVFDDVSKGKYVREHCDPDGGRRSYGIVTENANTVIELKGIDIITPTGDVIVPNMDLRVTPGMHLLITGPNGCGKSSLFRILSGLWPVYGGTLSRPPVSSLYYIPQRPYMSLGNLREQVIYPDTHSTMLRKGLADSDLSDILEKVKLNHIVSREGGWDAIRDWQDVLSGGEKQRIGLARLFYHKPSFALLDECTSAVSMDVEDSIYTVLTTSNINLLTISHRPSLFKHHTHVLRFHGDCKWTFREMDITKEIDYTL